MEDETRLGNLDFILMTDKDISGFLQCSSGKTGGWQISKEVIATTERVNDALDA